MATSDQRDDLRKVYLAVYANFACTTTDVADQFKGINTRYARELLGTLQTGGLIVITESDEGDCWQTIPDTYDTMSDEEAAARIDGWLSENLGAPAPATSTASRSALKSGATGPHDCGCGCGETITTRAVYRPGHDARHAGQIGREVAAIMEGGHDEGDQITIDSLYAMLPSEKLVEKAKRIASNANAKNLAKAQPTKILATEGTAKVGKNEVPARKWADGTVEVLPPGKDWQPASKSAARTFQEG